MSETSRHRDIDGDIDGETDQTHTHTDKEGSKDKISKPEPRLCLYTLHIFYIMINI